MPLLVASLLGGLVDLAGTLAGRVLLWLGFQITTFAGISSSLDWIKAQIASSFSGLSTTALDVLGALHVGTDLAIVAGAITARLALNGLSAGGSISRLVLKG